MVVVVPLHSCAQVAAGQGRTPGAGGFLYFRPRFLLDTLPPVKRIEEIRIKTNGIIIYTYLIYFSQCSKPVF